MEKDFEKLFPPLELALLSNSLIKVHDFADGALPLEEEIERTNFINLGSDLLSREDYEELAMRTNRLAGYIYLHV